MNKNGIFLQTRRSLITTLLASCALPGGILLLTTEESPAPVAVRGPRGGGAVAARPGVHRGPASPAGVARRTTRRTVRRLTVLPAGYRTVYYSGIRYYYVGGIYYQPYYEGNTVVYVEVNINQ